jgi:2,4-dienoyl-CoA reductase-like NADH-dependent reductase (Old Yellow Enzyme family)
MKTLFDEIKIGSLDLKNRIIRSSIADESADGFVSDKGAKRVEAAARDGAAAIITGMATIDGEERILRLPSLCSDSYTSGYRRLAGAARRHGARLIAQLAFVGSYILAKGVEIVVPAPSAVPNAVTGTAARAMRLGEIKTMQKNFADAARRAREAGCDGVELHSAHGLTLSQFLSPHYNKRTDAYGGNPENRARMLLETCDEIRRVAGYDFQIWVKLNCSDGLDDGISDADFLFTCSELSKKGVDAIEVSGEFYPATSEGAYFSASAALAAAEISTSVILTGGNRNAREMTDALKTKVECFGMARPFLDGSGPMEKLRQEAGM